ncbi:MAG: EamA family transporter, partial [Burkholderiaceae bacterium]
MPPQSEFTPRGYLLAMLAIAIFAMTLPLTRLAVGTESAPQMSGIFVASARACLAAVFSFVFLLVTHAHRPTAHALRLLVLVALGVVVGFTVQLYTPKRQVTAGPASVILGILPLTTAVAGAWLHRQRPSPLFWVCAVAGAVLVVIYSILRHAAEHFVFAWADALLALG